MILSDRRAFDIKSRRTSCVRQLLFKRDVPVSPFAATRQQQRRAIGGHRALNGRGFLSGSNDNNRILAGARFAGVAPAVGRKTKGGDPSTATGFTSDKRWGYFHGRAPFCSSFPCHFRLSPYCPPRPH